jgi:hypothetical protein
MTLQNAVIRAHTPAPRSLLTAPVLCARDHSALGKLRSLLEVLQVRDGRLLGGPCPHHTMRAVRSDGLNMISAAAGDNLVGLHDIIIWSLSRHSRMQPSRSPRPGPDKLGRRCAAGTAGGSCWVSQEATAKQKMSIDPRLPGSITTCSRSAEGLAMQATAPRSVHKRSSWTAP